MTAMPSGLSTRMNSDRAKGTSWGYRCSMLWDEKTASTDSEETEDMSVMVPTRSGLTDSSMSKRSSFQWDRALVVRSLRLGPQPTCRKVFMGFILKRLFQCLVSDSCSSAHSLCSTLPSHTRSPSCSCASLVVINLRRDLHP